MYNDMFWAGSETTYHAVAAAYKQAEARMGSGEMSSDLELYNREGSVGVVTIQGSLIPGNAGWMQYFGVTGYDDIRSALLKAAADPEASSVLLNFSSGGGAVTGMSDTADFIKQVAKIKPVFAYVDVAASAAYRLAIEAESIMVSDSGTTGSIGVLRMHREVSKQLEADGVKVSVLRAGEFKALLNPFEPLTPEAIAQEGERLAYLANIFNTAVQGRRGLTAEDMKTKAGEGREFLGQMGVKAGLADKVGNYEQALKMATKSVTSPKVKASVAQTLAPNAGTPQNAGNPTAEITMPKPTFTPEQLAALPSDDPIVLLAAAQTEIEAHQAAIVTADAAVATLTAELATANAAVTTAEAAVAASESALKLVEATATLQTATIETQAATIASFQAIALASLDNMSVALGGTKGAFATATPEAVLAEHAKVAETYTTKFKVGGVAAVAPITKPEDVKVPVVGNLFAALVQSTVNK